MTPNEIRNTGFAKAVSGYRVEEVTSFLASVATYLEQVLEDNEQLEEKIEILADKLEEYREDEESFRAALIGAQKLGDSVVRESRKKAEEILADASWRAEQMLTEAKKEADKISANAKYSIETEAYTLNRMQVEVAKFKRQILNMYRQHVELINSLPLDEEHLPEPLPKPSAPTRSAPAAEQDPAADPAITTFSFEYEEVSVTTGQPAPEDESAQESEEFPKRKSRFGELKFGEEYSLTRDE